jgi:hypothetical protein
MKIISSILIFLLFAINIRGQSSNNSNSNSVTIGRIGDNAQISLSIKGNPTFYNLAHNKDVLRLTDSLSKYSKEFKALLDRFKSELKYNQTEQNKLQISAIKKILSKTLGKTRLTLNEFNKRIKNFDLKLDSINKGVVLINKKIDLQEETSRNYGTLSFDSLPLIVNPLINNFGFSGGYCELPDSEKLNIILGEGNLVCLPAFGDTVNLEDLSKYVSFDSLEYPIKFLKENGKIYINAVLRDYDHKQIAVIDHNEWSNTSNIFDRNYDGLAYEIIDSYGVILLQIQIVGLNTIKIKGFLLVKKA